VFLLLAFSFRLPAAPGCPRRRVALHPVVARQVDHTRPALFLSRFALCQVLGAAEAAVSVRQADGLQAVVHHETYTHPRPLAAACRIAHARVLHRDAAAEYSQHHQHPDLDFRPACVQVAGHVLEMAAKGGTSVAPSPPVLLPGSLSLQGTEVVRLVCPSRVQMVKALGLLVQEALLSLRAAVVRLALVLLARTVRANHLPEPLSRQKQLYAQSIDLHSQPVMGCRLLGRRRELAVEYSWDFRF